MPSPAALNALDMPLMKPDGLFCFCPNGLLAFRQRKSHDWNHRFIRS
ncbi:hypothetical protein [Prosthecobacter sp.]